MSYYVELFTSDSKVPNYTLNEKSVILQANRMIPIFWFLLFDSNSYYYVLPIDKHESDSEDKPQPFCTISLKKAINLYSKRIDKLFEIIPSDWKILSSEFLEFLGSNSLQFVHLSLVEFAQLGDDEKRFEQNFKKTLSGLTNPPIIYPTGFFSKFLKPKISSDWRNLLEWAEINTRKPDKIKSWQLAGDGSGDAPWD